MSKDQIVNWDRGTLQCNLSVTKIAICCLGNLSLRFAITVVLILFVDLFGIFKQKYIIKRKKIPHLDSSSWNWIKRPMPLPLGHGVILRSRMFALLYLRNAYSWEWGTIFGNESLLLEVISFAGVQLYVATGGGIRSLFTWPKKFRKVTLNLVTLSDFWTKQRGTEIPKSVFKR